MAIKYLNKKVTTTTVKGFALGADGTPEPASIMLAGRYNQEKATKEIRKNVDSNFMVTGVEHGEQFYRVALNDFIKFAQALSDEEAANTQEGESESEDAPAEAQEAATAPKRSRK